MSSGDAQFDALCAELGANNPNRTVINNGSLPHGFGFRLGQALSTNTVVSEINLDLLPVRVDGGNVRADNISMVLRFLRRAASLRNVTFFQGTPLYTDQCIRALSQSPSLQELALGDEVKFSASALAPLLEMTQTLLHVSLSAAVADDDQVAAALGANCSITNLMVHHINESTNAAFLRHISHRRATPPPLQEMWLAGPLIPSDYLGDVFIEAVSKFASSAFAVIPTLSIADVKIFTDFSAIVDALSCCPCMIDKFELERVDCDEEVAAELLSTVEAQLKSSHRSSSRRHSNNAATNALKEIVFEGSMNNVGSANVTLVTALTLSAQYTLERLEIQWYNEGEDVVDIDHSVLWTKMEEQVCTTSAQSRPFQRFGEIALDHVLTGHDDAMIRCLPKLVSLHTLTTNPRRSPEDRRYQHSAADAIRFAAAIRRNGSLTKLDMPDQFTWSAAAATDPTMLTDSVDRIIVAALQRNKMLPILLARLPTGTVAAAAAQDNQDDTDRVLPLQGRCLYPHLFASVLPAEFMTPHFVLMGLTKLLLQGGDSESDTVLSASGKRSAPSTME